MTAGIALEIGSRLRDGTFKNCVAKCPGGGEGGGERNDPPKGGRGEAEGELWGEAGALLQGRTPLPLRDLSTIFPPP